MADETLTILFFAWVREVTGKDQDQVPFPADGLTGSQVIDILVERYPGLKDRASRLHIAVNQDHVAPSTPLKPSDEVALFPPVTGG
jgi:molybdopterin synthase sulfur carrier subunit